MSRFAYQFKARTSDKSKAVANSEMNKIMLTAVSILFSILILPMSVQPLNMENLNDLFRTSRLKRHAVAYEIIGCDKLIIKLTSQIMNTRMPVEA